MKQPDNENMISSIVSRRDELNQKAVAVNNHLKVLCYNDYITILSILTTLTYPVGLT